MSALVTLVVMVLLQQAPARDRAVAPTAMASGTASVSGVVMTDDDNPQPVRHATVGLSTGVISLPRLMVTDEEGRFRFVDLPEGSYRIVAQKPAWVPVASGVRSGGIGIGIGSGMAGIAGQGVPLAVREGQSVEGVTLRLQRGAVISGVVRMPGGRVGAGMTVQALQTARVDGARVASMIAQPGTTDDLGRYRIYGLAPGEYVLQVRAELIQFGTQEVRLVLPSEVAWAEGVLAQAQAARAPGLQAGALPLAPDPGPTVAYATTYFPGTAYLSDAAGIVLRAGDQRLDVDVELRQVPTATVTGSVTGVDGRPASAAMVSLALPPSGGQENFFDQLIGAAQTTTRADGTFVLTGVQPGAYMLNVRAAPPAPAGARQAAGPEAIMAGMMAGLAGGMMGGVGGAMSLWAREPIQVDGLPVGPLGLQLRDGLSVSGTLVLEGDGAPAPDAVRITLAEPQANTGMPDMAMFRLNQSVGQATAEGTFTINGVVPSRYQLSVMMPGWRLSATEPGAGWMIKSVRLGDRDLADEGVDLNAGTSLSGLVVTLTNRPSELTGRVLDAASQPFSAFPLVVFSADRAHWGVGSRRVHTVQPATDGSYVVAGLPAGTYYLAAVTNIDPKELASAAFLESLIGSALSVTLSDGERKTQDVRLAGG